MATQSDRRATVGGPYFEDFEVGQVFREAPGLTLTPGHAAMHQALVGDRLRLALDAHLSQTVTGAQQSLAHPNLVCDVAIGQSTGPSQRVRGNLFYRGLMLLAPVFVGDTLRTDTEIVGLKQNRGGEGRAPTGLVAMRIRTENQDGEAVLDFWRCPVIPLRDADAETGHADRFEGIPQDLELEDVEAAVPGGWRLDRFRELVAGEHFEDIVPDTVYAVEGRDTVTAPPELARLTLNVAHTHTDAGASAHGHRLAYGGHTIAIAAAHATRALPNLVTIIGWRGCDHTAPVFEGDILQTELTVEQTHPLEDGGLVSLRALVVAERGESGERADVLDWRFIGLMA